MNPRTKVIILSGSIQTGDVVSALLDGSIVVMETLRTHAKEIVASTAIALGLDDLPEGESGLMHLSIQIHDRGWSHFLFHLKFLDYDPGIAKALVINAVKKWEAAGSPDKWSWDPTHDASSIKQLDL